MSRQFAKLNALYRDLSDRYGPDDPILIQLKEEIEREDALATVLPFGERRKENRRRHVKGQRFGQGHARLNGRPALTE